MNGWIIFALCAVAFVALGFFLDRILVRVMLWHEDRLLEKHISDEVVALFYEERDKRRSND